MAPEAAPDGDVSTKGRWLDETGDPNALFESIDEATADDTDYVEGPITEQPMVLVSWTPS